MKKLIPVMIAAALLVVVFAVSDTDSEASLPGTYVNGQVATYATVVDEPNEHWKYDSSALTITGDSVFDKYTTDGTTSYCIYDPTGPLNLVLNADLTITAYDETALNITLAIYSGGSITISGPGKLTINHGTDGHHIDQGLTAAGSITIDGPSVEILSGADIIASQAEWGSAFTMKSGSLNLIGSGTIDAENVFIKGGIIYIESSCGLMRDQITAYSLHKTTNTIEMTGGTVTFANVKADASLLLALGDSYSLDMHGAGGSNWVQDDYMIKAVSDGSVTIKSINVVRSEEDPTLDEKDTPVLAATGIIALMALILLAGYMFGKKD